MSNMLRIDIQNVLDYTEYIIQNVLDELLDILQI